jgi:hypothetical protein
LKPFEQEEGQLRQRAQALGSEASDAEVRSQVARSTRAQMLASQADRADGPEAVRAVFEEARLTQDPDAIRLVGVAASQRLRQLAEPDKGKAMSTRRDAALAFDQEFQQWRRTNPSPVERLGEIERRRAQEAILFKASAEFALQLFGIEPAPMPVVNV